MEDDTPKIVQPENEIDEREITKQGPVDQLPADYDTVQITQDRQCHTKAVFGFICFILFLGTAIYCAAAKMAVMIGSSVILLIIYLSEAFCSNTYRFLRSQSHLRQTEEFLQEMRAIVPRLHFTCTCSHTEQRSRTVYTTNSDGSTSSHTEYYTVTVVTFRGEEEYEIVNWRDISSSSRGLEKYDITKIYLAKYVKFHTPEDRQHFNEMFENFQAKHRHRDVQFSANWHFNVPGFCDKQLCYTGDEPPPEVSVNRYILFTLLGGSLFYRNWLSSASMMARFTVVKEVSFHHYLEPIEPITSLRRASSAIRQPPIPTAPKVDEEQEDLSSPLLQNEGGDLPV